MSDQTPKPTKLTYHSKSKVLDVAFADGETFALPAEYLRVFSPSAEVRGHGGGKSALPAILVVGKEDVGIERIEPTGNYAVRLIFDDGHDSGIFSWSFLRELGENQETNWAAYRERLGEAGQAPGGGSRAEPKPYRPGGGS